MKQRIEALYTGMLLYTSMLDTNVTSHYTWSVYYRKKDIFPAHNKVQFMIPVKRVLMPKSPVLLYINLVTSVMTRRMIGMHDVWTCIHG